MKEGPSGGMNRPDTQIACRAELETLVSEIRRRFGLAHVEQLGEPALYALACPPSSLLPSLFPRPKSNAEICRKKASFCSQLPQSCWCYRLVPAQRQATGTRKPQLRSIKT